MSLDLIVLSSCSTVLPVVYFFRWSLVFRFTNTNIPASQNQKKSFASSHGKGVNPLPVYTSCKTKDLIMGAGRCPRLLMSVFWIVILIFIAWPIAFVVAGLWLVLMVSHHQSLSAYLMHLCEGLSIKHLFLTF